MPNATKRQVESWWYVLLSEREKPKAEQSRFFCRPLRQYERMHVWDDSAWITIDADGKKTVSARGFQQAHELCLTHLVATENFPLDEVKPWPDKGSKEEKEAYLEMLDDMDLFEIGNAIREKSTLGAEVKNS